MKLWQVLIVFGLYLTITIMVAKLVKQTPKKDLEKETSWQPPPPSPRPSPTPSPFTPPPLPLPTVAHHSCLKKLKPCYCIAYGPASAPIKVVEFFSLQCPHCIRLFRNDFEQIKKELIETGQVSFTFHPVPQDLTTIQAMLCLEKLSEQEKRLFLEVLFEEANPLDQPLMTKLMMTAMNVFKKPLPQLDDPDFLRNNALLEEVYPFLKQTEITAVPTVEINDHLFPQEIPSYLFIKSFTKR